MYIKINNSNVKLQGHLLFLFLCLPFYMLAQDGDTLKLSCALNESLKPPPEQHAYSIGAEDKKAIWVSKTDTIVKACSGGVITTLLHDADGKWEVMFSHEDYSFWYSGLTAIVIAKGQRIHTGEAIGAVKHGDQLEVQMFDQETSLDPKPYLDCGK
jgi:hypothetical protein